MKALAPPLLALGFVLIASTDFELRVAGIDERICVKSREVCETARLAIMSGRWDLGISPDAPTICVPSPGCFSPASECIKNWNCESVRSR